MASQCKASTALVVTEDEPSKFYNLAVGHGSIGWVVIADDSWPQHTDPAFESLFIAVKKLLALDDPRVNQILQESCIRFLEPTTKEINP